MLLSGIFLVQTFQLAANIVSLLLSLDAWLQNTKSGFHISAVIASFFSLTGLLIEVYLQHAFYQRSLHLTDSIKQTTGSNQPFDELL